MIQSMLLAMAILVTAVSQPLGAQPKVFRGATIIPIVGQPIQNGVLIIDEGRIVAVGEAGTQSPPNAAEYDVSGKVIMPGLVDSHSHVGRVDGGDASAALHPDVRTIDAIDVRHHSLNRARAGGITTVNVMSGSGHLMSGQTVYMKLRHGRVIDDLLFCEDPINDICGGMKMANGTNSIRSDPGRFPQTRSRSAAMIRALFLEGQAYRERVDRADGDPSAMPSRDLRLDAIAEILRGERLVHFHTHRHDDILTVLRLKEEFGFRVVLHHVSEAWKVADEIAAAGIPSSIIVLDSPGGKLEAAEIRYENGAALERAGADISYHTDDYVTDSRLFIRSAAFGVRGGMSREKALEAVTLAGARMMDLDHRVGSLEVGKDADFIVLSGDPLSVYTRIEQTWIEGEKVFDYSDAEQRLWATGGHGVFAEPGTMHVHGHDH
jgi:imidazolonepropionase-like amidohydrolase